MEAETSEQEHFVSQDLRTGNVGSEALKGEQLFYLYERFYPELRNGLTIIKSDTYGDCFHEGEWVSCEGITFTVKNDTPYDIPGKAYSILYKEGYWGKGNHPRRRYHAWRNCHLENQGIIILNGK